MAKTKRAPMFPIRYVWGQEKLHSSHDTPVFIAWSEAERAYAEYCARNTQPAAKLDHIAARGGFSASEMDDLAPGWKERHAGRSVAAEEAEAAATLNERKGRS